MDVTVFPAGLGEPRPSGLLLAVDAGNSKTDVALVSPDGAVVATARGGGFSPPTVGIDTAVDALEETVRQAAEAVGARLGEPFAGQVSACLANADLPVEEEQLLHALHARGWARSTHVANDTFAVLRAGVDEPCGVAVVCGAGINCVGMLPDGRTARFPALGRLSGDWGGGAGLAEEALWWAARAEDGRGEPTVLAEALPAHFGLGSVHALIEALHLRRLPAGRRHEMTPVLFRAASAGDAVARAIVRRQAEEIVAFVGVALSRLGLLEETVPVVLGGSVLAARHPLLEEGIAELLAERAPRAVPRVVTAPPVLGAALLGLDRAGAPDAAYATLRAHYATPVPREAPGNRDDRRAVGPTR